MQERQEKFAAETGGIFFWLLLNAYEIYGIMGYSFGRKEK